MWSDYATNAFKLLQSALSSAPVLSLPSFFETFTIEADASGKVIGVVLMQNQHPIPYISNALGPRHQTMSIYERELLAIVCVVQKWGAYLSHALFIIKTDQKSIKHIMEQRLHTPFQHVLVSKLMGLSLRFITRREALLYLVSKGLSYCLCCLILLKMICLKLLRVPGLLI